MKLFDSLVHATDDGFWLGSDRYEASLNRLINEMDVAEVPRACLVAIADYIDNDSVLRMAAAHPSRLIPIGSINPGALGDTLQVQEAVSKLAAQGFAGLKLHPRLNNYDPLDKRCLTAIQTAGAEGIPVFLDTLFRQRRITTRAIADVIDEIAHACSQTKIVLLHSGGHAMLNLFELGRMHSHLILDLSFTIMRYRGSSLDLDMKFLCGALDQRLIVGSDFPEYVPSEVISRMRELCHGLPDQKVRNILHGNLDKLFEGWLDKSS